MNSYHWENERTMRNALIQKNITELSKLMDVVFVTNSIYVAK